MSRLKYNPFGMKNLEKFEKSKISAKEMSDVKGGFILGTFCTINHIVLENSLDEEALRGAMHNARTICSAYY
ncbi:MAG: hypothetical protein ACKVOQ_06595 [Cyclobacteriaceae bacterium]